MQKKVSIKTEPLRTASDLLQEFLSTNNIVLTMEIQPQGFVNSGDGFLMTDKPLLKITPKFKG